MICKYCGYESSNDFDICPNCGKVLHNSNNSSEYVEVVNGTDNNFYGQNVNTTFEAVKNTVSDKKFKISLILLSVSCGITIVSKSIPILQTLLLIFGWLLYSENQNGKLSYINLRRISGIVFAKKVLSLVFGFLALGLVGLDVGKNSIITYLDEFDNLLGNGITSSILNSEIAVAVLVAIVVAILVVLGVYLLILGFCGYNRIHKFLKTTYLGMENTSYKPEKASSASGWIVFLAVCQFTAAASGLLSGKFLLCGAEVCAGLALIFCSKLINKYF